MPNNFQKTPEKLKIDPNLENPGIGPVPPQKTKAKAKSKTGLVIGLIAAVLVIVSIGAGILYFAGVFGPETQINVDLSKLDAAKTDLYMVYKSENGVSGLRLSTEDFINHIDAGVSPFSNPISLISPDVCSKLKEEINAQNWKFVLSTANPPTDQSMTSLSLSYDQDYFTKNKIYALIVDQNNQEVSLKDAEKLLGYPLPPPRFIYDPSYMIINGEGSITPLAIGETTVKARACDIETNLLTILIPEGIENLDPIKVEQTVDETGKVISTETSYGTYDSDFLQGLAQTQKISTEVANAQSAKVDFTALYQKDNDGYLAMLLSLDGGQTWVPQNEKEPVKLQPQKQNLKGSYYSQDNTYTFNLNNAEITDLRLLVFTQNTTKAGAKIPQENVNTAGWVTYVEAMKNANAPKYELNKFKDSKSITQKSLFMLPNKEVIVEAGNTPGVFKNFKYSGENIIQAGSSIAASVPHYNQFVFIQPGNEIPGPSLIKPIIQPPISKLPFEIIKKAKANDEIVITPTPSSYTYNVMVLPESTPILEKAVITFETAGGFKFPPTKGKFPETTPEATPILETPTSEISPVTTPTVEGPLNIQPSVWHRGYNRAIVKWTFTEGVDNNVNPNTMVFEYGESESSINKGAKVYKDKSDGKYYAVLRGLKGGEFSDKNDGGYENGRYPYYFTVSIGDKSTPAKSFKTLNRLQTIAYYYTLLLDATYLTQQDEDNLKKYESLDNTVMIADKEYKVRDLENGGMNFHYKPEGKNAQSLLGVKFTMANDRKFKEFDKKLAEISKGTIGVTEAEAAKAKKEKKAEKEGVRMLYRRILDRIYDEDLGKFYDKDGVDFWVAMTDKDLIRNYYKDKDEKDVIDIYGVKFAISVSKEYQSEQLAGLGTELLAQAKADLAYQIVLKRGGDQEGVSFLTSKFGTAKDMRKYLALSAEYETRLADIEKQFGKKAAIEELYETLYGRPSDVKGVEYWLASGKSILDLRDTFLASNEFTKVIKE